MHSESNVNSETLWQQAIGSDQDSRLRLWTPATNVRLSDLKHGSSLSCPLDELHGCSVCIITSEQLLTSLALVELDGIASRMVLCPPDLSPEQAHAVVGIADADVIVADQRSAEAFVPVGGRFVTSTADLAATRVDRTRSCATEWILLTSGTTGSPKLVRHNLATLSGAIPRASFASTSDVVWSTFYDIRRYGGLQIFLRALLGGASLVLSSAQESVAAFLIRGGACNVTHISGTPSHWRRALMSSAVHKIAPRYIRLSGEIADQAILDHLHGCYPKAEIVHAFASTEAGVGFAVSDGMAGFPAGLISQTNAGVELKLENGSLQIRSPRNALGYLGAESRPVTNADGFVDTGDVVELRQGRYYFVGRRDGTINVGGQKVHPEEVEAVINQVPGVQMALVKARRNAVMGALVVADVVPQSIAEWKDSTPEEESLKHAIMSACQTALAPHKVPAVIRFVPSLEVTGPGKLARSDA